MKFGQSIEHPKRNICLKKLCRNLEGNYEEGILAPDHKDFILGKSKWSSTLFYYISISRKLAYDRKKLLKTLHYWSRDMLNFDILDNGLGIVSSAHFVYDFSPKMFLMLYSINWPNGIAWLPLLLEILSNMCIAIDC